MGYTDRRKEQQEHDDQDELPKGDPRHTVPVWFKSTNASIRSGAHRKKTST